MKEDIKVVANPDLDNRFNYHKPSEENINKHEAIRSALRMQASLLDTLLPDSREKALALTRLEEAMFWSNAAIARN